MKKMYVYLFLILKINTHYVPDSRYIIFDMLCKLNTYLHGKHNVYIKIRIQNKVSSKILFLYP